MKDKFIEILLNNKVKIKESIDECRKTLTKNIAEIIFNINNNNNYYGKIIRNEIIIKFFKIYGITNELKGYEDYLFNGFDAINKLTILQEKRKNQNEKAILHRYQRRNDSETFSESERSNGEDIENEINDINFL